MFSSLTHLHEHEHKQEIAEEAARDPHTNFSAEDADKVLVEESKKAGAPAFHFDPNATPEEKAAQARAVGSVCRDIQDDTNARIER